MRARPSAAELAIDLGTSHTRIAARGKGVVFDAPSVIATRPGARGAEVVAVGREARRMLGRAPSDIQVTRPVRAGVIVDFDAAAALLRHALGAVGARGIRGPRVLAVCPLGLTEVERRALTEACRAAGAREVHLAASPLLAAMGAGIPVNEPSGSLVVDVGGGRTHVGIASLGGLVVGRWAAHAGNAMDTALVAWIREQHSLLVAEQTAESLKLRAGAAAHADPLRSMRIRGRDLPTGASREIDVTSHDTAEALAGVVGGIRQLVLEALGAAPPEIAGDIHDRGLVLCGGGSGLALLDRVLSDATGLPALQPDAPDRCVALGAAALLDDPALFARLTA